jgi:uncharacterized membrane protein
MFVVVVDVVILVVFVVIVVVVSVSFVVSVVFPLSFYQPRHIGFVGLDFQASTNNSAPKLLAVVVLRSVPIRFLF